MHLTKKRIFTFLLSSLLFSGLFIFAAPAPNYAYACSCVPNKAVFPNGNDPTCPNGTYIGSDPGFCGSSAAGNSSSVGGIRGLSSISCNPRGVKDFKGLVTNLLIGCLLSPAVYFVISLSVIIFLWGIFKFIRSEEGGEERKAGKELMFYGIIGLFVIISIWGLVNILQSSFHLS